jgi:hypothetical protein
LPSGVRVTIEDAILLDLIQNLLRLHLLRLHLCRRLWEYSSQMAAATMVLSMVLLPTLRLQRAYASFETVVLVRDLVLLPRVTICASAANVYPLVRHQEELEF